MTCNSRTVNTLSASPDLTTLRAELDRVCREIEDEGTTVDNLGPEIVRLGMAISLPISGPVSAMAGLHGLLMQLANAFPDEWEIAKAKLTSRG